MLVEFVGISGSGKSTLIKAVKSELRNRGVKTRCFYKYCSRARLVDEGHWKQAASDEEKAERYRLLSLLAFCGQHPELTRNLHMALRHAAAQRSDCAGVMSYISQMEELDHEHFVVIADEGLLHRGVAAHTLAADPKLFREFLEFAVFPDRVVHLQISADEAERRAIDRVLPRRREAIAARRQPVAFYQRQSDLFEAVAQRAAEKGVDVDTVDAMLPIEENAVRIADGLVGVEGLETSLELI